MLEDIKEDEDEVETAESHEKCEDIVDEEVCEIANEKVMEEAAADVKENVVAWTQHQDKVPITPIGSHGGNSLLSKQNIFELCNFKFFRRTSNS